MLSAKWWPFCQGLLYFNLNINNTHRGWMLVGWRTTSQDCVCPRTLVDPYPQCQRCDGNDWHDSQHAWRCGYVLSPGLKWKNIFILTKKKNQFKKIVLKMSSATWQPCWSSLCPELHLFQDICSFDSLMGKLCMARFQLTHWSLRDLSDLRWMPWDLTDRSTLVQVMAWGCQATSHYLNWCLPRSVSTYGVTTPQWV